MDWSTLSNIATTASAVLGAASLFAGFYIYYITKRDAYADKFRLTLVGVRSKVEQLDDLLNSELAHELISIVLNSEEVKYITEKSYKDFFLVPEATEEDLKKFLESEFPLLATSFNTDIVRRYEKLITDIESDISQYQKSFPGLHRIVSPAIHIFKAILRGNKRFVREEGFWREMIVVIFKQQRDRADSIEFLRSQIRTLFVALLENKRKKHDQDDIGDLIEIIHIVTDAYMSLNEHQLISQKNRERKEKLRSSTETELVTDDIKEAEKCLRHLVNQDSLLDLRELTTKINQRNSENKPS